MINWKHLTTSADLAQALELSKTQPVALFKHSTRCGISFEAKERLEEAWDFEPHELEIYYLDLLNYRPISNQIAQDLGILHQSPQLLLLRDGQVVYHASHHNINVNSIHKALK